MRKPVTKAAMKAAAKAETEAKRRVIADLWLNGALDLLFKDAPVERRIEILVELAEACSDAHPWGADGEADEIFAGYNRAIVLGGRKGWRVKTRLPRQPRPPKGLLP